MIGALSATCQSDIKTSTARDGRVLPGQCKANYCVLCGGGGVGGRALMETRLMVLDVPLFSYSMSPCITTPY